MFSNTKIVDAHFPENPYLCGILKQSFYLKNLILIENRESTGRETRAFFFLCLFPDFPHAGLHESLFRLAFVLFEKPVSLE